MVRMMKPASVPRHCEGQSFPLILHFFELRTCPAQLQCPILACAHVTVQSNQQSTNKIHKCHFCRDTKQVKVKDFFQIHGAAIQRDVCHRLCFLFVGHLLSLFDQAGIFSTTCFTTRLLTYRPTDPSNRRPLFEAPFICSYMFCSQTCRLETR